MFELLTPKRALVMLALVALAASSFAGCGGDKKQPPQNPFGPSPQTNNRQPRPAPAPKPKRHVNKNWMVVRVHYKAYLQQIENMEMDKVRDPFEDQKPHWLPKPLSVVKIEPKKVEQPKPKVPLAERPPLERYSVGRYRLKAIMSATDVPKALLIDPEGNGFIVWKNRTIGTEKGQIVAINQYEVIVKIPGRDPLRLSIAPRFDIFKTVQ